MNNRIKEVRISTGLKQDAFGARIGVSAAAVSRWESADRAIPDSAVLAICREFGVNETWLRTGVGQMTASKTRAQEMGELFSRLFADRPESFRVALLTTLLRFDPNGPEWEILERIYDSVVRETYQASPPAPAPQLSKNPGQLPDAPAAAADAPPAQSPSPPPEIPGDPEK